MTTDEMINEICNQFKNCYDGCPFRTSDMVHICAQVDRSSPEIIDLVEKTYKKIFSPIDEDALLEVLLND